MSYVTDEQIKQLRNEAAVAGDMIQVVICDIALADGLGDEIPASVDVVGHMALERVGVHVASIRASDEARRVCVNAIVETGVQS